MTDTVDEAPAPDRTRLLELQRLLLPVSLPDVGCTELAAAYRSHNHELQLGGDWFDLIDRPQSSSVVAVVGDVVGHGVEQISVMGQLRAASNALAHAVEEAGAIVDGLDSFGRDLPGAALATVAVLVLDASTTGHIVCAGHPPPILVHADGSRELLEMGRRAPLAIGGPTPSGTFEYSIGDLIVMYTDGVVERRTRTIDEGIAALGDFVSARRHDPCRTLSTAIVDEFGAAAEDDQAVVVMRPLHNRADGYRLDKRTAPSVSIA